MQKQQSSVAFDDAALRANTYSLLARLLRKVPDPPLLDVLSRIESANKERQNGFGLSWHLLKLNASRARLSELDDEFHDLFIGLGHGEVIPYASWYRTGYLMDRPLARLRHDLRQLGIERQQQVSEPEDHIAALCEAMAMLIDSGSDLEAQQTFYRLHLHGWLQRCFRDIEQAPSARFYKAVGQLGQHFVELEQHYLDVPDD
ncbi:MAG: molecular chaperone TorD family protein [Thiohalophilus sp.]|uniref:TorD/DmsD family molecular chaperone n=1 Tax=Thiohalophilus sp. TaxID=3028392 RepID=UPI0028704429|nr:molecular chaperone TorD family protein [Thiohalophilus sp.]MDR9436850.1 molecular chaperone TorD family protein [Thiohalophilus sp.]